MPTDRSGKESWRPRAPAVLIVDQNVERRFGIKQIVIQTQFEVCGEVGYGAAAVSLATEMKPDVIMCAMEKLLIRSAQTVESLIDALPETPIIVYSPDSDLAVARQAMSTGARDFLAMPILRDDLRQALVAALESADRRYNRNNNHNGASEAVHPKGIILTVFGPKGGIGKTTVVTNLSVALASSGQSAVTVDADAGFGDVAGMLDIQPERTILELAQHIKDVSRENLPRFLLPHPSGLMLLAAPPMALDWRNVSLESFRLIVEALARGFDVEIIDTSGTLDEISIESLQMASCVLWISTTDYSSVKDSQTALRVLRGMNFPMDRIRLLVNETSPVDDVRPEAVADTLELPVFWHVPYDRELRRASQTGRPVVEMAPNSKVAKSFRELAQRISGAATEHEAAAAPLSRFRLKKGPRTRVSVDEPQMTATLRGDEI